jgi:3'-phosphoadenosine 5'-phosphosulfate sulfotransferase (PAPS reductase)/FAD synthetase
MLRDDLREFAVWAKTRAHADRVERARAVLRRAAEIGPLVVSTSYGKDSTVLLDLAAETLGRVDSMHLSSPYRLPGWEPVAAWTAAHSTLHVVPARRSLAETIAWLREIGLGYEREGRRQVGARAKGDRGDEYAREAGFVARALGLRAEESAQRKRFLLARGALYQRRTDGAWIANPLAWFTLEDVWARVVTRGLPYHRLYDCTTHGMTKRTLRNSGWLTTIGAVEGRIAWLRRHFPAQYRVLVAEFPQVALLG